MPAASGTLLRGDCLEHMSKLPAGSFRAVVTSPPYNLRNSTGNGMRGTSGGKWTKPALASGYHGHDDSMDHADYVAWQRECLAEMLRLTADDGAIFYNHKPRVQGGLWQDRHDITDGFPVRQVLIWHRAGGVNFNPGYFLPDYETIHMIAKPAFRLTPDAARLGCVWRIPQDTRNEHPAPMPLAIATRCIRAAGGGPVLDPFLGSGTTAVAAEQAKADWTGIEISDEYADMAEKRIAQARAARPLPGI